MGEQGQASIETAALLPLLALVAVLAWQAVVAGQTAWMAATAAGAAARAAAIGADPERAARAVLPRRLERELRVRTGADGVSVRVAIPVVVGGSIGAVTRRAAFPAQRS